MNDGHEPPQRPHRLLLATDLSARCDRALDRAAQLARAWQAELVALTVLEAPQVPDLALAWAAGDDEAMHALAVRELRLALAELDVPASVRILRGDPVQAIHRVAAESDCGLIVTGMARSELLGRFLLGSTVNALARALTRPLLVVRNRPRGPYRRIAVATDFSASSRHALHAAAVLFPDEALTLYHAFGLPLSGMASPESVQARRAREIEHGECARFLRDSALAPEQRSRLATAIEAGAVAPGLTRYVRRHEIDLVVLGARGRSGLMDALIGSTAAELLDWLPCDTLLVREPELQG